MAPIQTPGLGELLRRYRRAAGLTQEELAERAGVSTRSISDLERGIERRPHRETIQLFVQALKLTDEERRSLEQAVGSRLRRDPSSLQPSTTGASSGHPPFRLPTPTNRLVGREDEVAAVCVRLQQEGVRLVTLTGPGGVGKSRLALQVAHTLMANFPDGVIFISLASISEPDLVASAIARRLSIQEGGQQSLLGTLTEFFSSRRILLVLDSFEHLLEAAPLVSNLLVSSPGLQMLITSRAVLRVSAEHEFPVVPLSVPDNASLDDPGRIVQYDAVRLFVERARAVRPAFEVTDQLAPTIAMICMRLDGLPLAVELAAARIRLFPPPDLLRRLSNRFQVLTDGPRDLPARQQTLQLTLDWSYHLLPPREQRLLARLSVFSGGWTLEAAEAVCGGEGDEELSVLDGLTALVEHSMVRQVGDSHTEHRFMMLDTIREYALEHLHGRDEADVQRRHAEYFLALSNEAGPQLEGPRQDHWLQRLDEEHDNLRTALARWLDPGAEEPSARSEQVLRMVTMLWRYWHIRGYWSEARTWLRAGLAATSGISQVRAEALNIAGTAALFQGSHDEAVQELRRSLEMSRALEDLCGMASSITFLGYVAAFEMDREQVPALVEQAVALKPHLTHQLNIAYLDIFLSLAAVLDGDFARAIELQEESLALFAEIRDARGMRLSRANLGLMALGDGQVDRAATVLTETLQLSQGARDVLSAQNCLLGLGAVASLRGQPLRAVRLWGAADGLRQRHGLHLNHLLERYVTDYVAATRSQLGEAVFASLWQEGAATTLDVVVAEVLGQASGTAPA